MSDINTAPRAELIALVYELIDKVALLEAEIARLKEQLKQRGKDADKESDTPDFVKLSVKKSSKKKKRKKRAKSYHRLREEPDKQIFHTLDCCPDCGDKITTKPSVAYTRQAIDIPETKYEVTEHIICRNWCLNCEKRVMPDVDLSDVVIGNTRIGLNLASQVSVMRDRLRLPVNLIQSYLKLVYQLDLSQGEIVKICHTVADMGRDSYNNILEQLRDSTYINADETGGREDGINGYYWSFSNKEAHYLMYNKSRSQKVVHKVVGEDSEYFDGVMVSDFYTAYSTYAGFHQRCWVHLLRDIRELKKQHKNHPPLNVWAKKVRDIYEKAKTYPGPDPGLPLGLAANERVEKQKYYQDELKKVCEPYLSKDVVMSTLCGRIMTYLPELFVFVRIPEVPSDNNGAERMVRHTVVSRKISGCTRSARGSETKSILTSLFDTWKLRGLNPLEQCKLMLAS